MRRIVLVLTVIAMVGAALAACSAPASAPAAAAPGGDSLHVENAWARPSPLPDGNSAIYLTIVNPTGEADRLVAVKSSVGMAETHESVTENGVVRMEPRPDGYEIPAQSSVELAPGGKHIMVMGVADPLAPGDTLTATLTFEKAGEMTVTAPVKEQP